MARSFSSHALGSGTLPFDCPGMLVLHVGVVVVQHAILIAALDGGRFNMGHGWRRLPNEGGIVIDR